MKNIFLTAVLFTSAICHLTSYISSAQAPAIQWQKCLGGSGYDYPIDAPQTIAVTSAGNYIAIGTTFSTDGDLATINTDTTAQVWVVYLNSSGNIIWQKTFGGSKDDYGVAIIQTTDGGFLFVGRTKSNDGNVTGGGFHGGYGFDYWAVKLDISGNIQWQKCFGGTSTEFGNTLIQSSDGNYIIGGQSFSNDGDLSAGHCAYDYWVVKINPSGIIIWEKNIGGSGNEYLISMAPTSDGGCILNGRTESFDGVASGNHNSYDQLATGYPLYDYLVVKLDASGNTQWYKTYGGSDWEWGNCIIQTSDGGYVASGYTYTFSNGGDGDVTLHHGEFDYWMVKTNSSGVIQWATCYGGDNYELGYGTIQTADGGYAMIGGSPSNSQQVQGNHGGWDYWLIKTNSGGQLQWQKCMGGSDYEAGYALQQTPDGGYIIFGESQSNDQDVSGNQGGGGDFWIVKLAGTTGVEENNIANSINISPNPTSGAFKLQMSNVKLSIINYQLSIYNVLGERVYEMDNGQLSIDLSSQPSGIYFIKVQTEKESFTQKLIIRK